MASRERATTERSAGGVVVRRTADSVHVLLIRDPYGKWGLPKGHLEGEETSVEAAVREVEEETGLAPLSVGPGLGTIDWYFRLEGRLIHKFCDYFLMVSAAGDPTPEVAEGITECLWVALDEVAETVAYDNARTVVERACEIIRDGGADTLLDEAP
jgi:8-oxo-dGTP pyrophosphatase MutT (NUDIX family)